MIDELLRLVRVGFEEIKDVRKFNQTYSLSSMLGLSFAMFHLKDSSLSSFREQYSIRFENLKSVYGVNVLPGDTAIREAIDTVSPGLLQNMFRLLFSVLNKHQVLKKRQVLASLGGYTAVAVDGTGYYCSGNKSCVHCLVKTHRNGEQSYYHQALGAVCVHPNEATVFPIAAEAIVKQDGDAKNDCELNAVRRLIPQIREVLSKEKIVCIFDALYCNGPHIQRLQEADIRFVIATKGQTYTDVQAEQLRGQGGLKQVSWTQGSGCKTQIYTVNYVNDLPLNGQHRNIRVNYFEIQVQDKHTEEQLYYSTFITDIPITDNIVKEIAEVARSRWKIENETFNTLKNQGYHLEHNYGHGKKYLATNFMILTFLAFLIDQMAQYLDKDFQAAKQVAKTFKSLWEKTRSVFYLIPTTSIGAVYRFIAKQQQVNIPALE